jgi:hypothetical protein
MSEKSPYTDQYATIIWFESPYVRLGYMSSQSVCASWCWTHKLVRLHVLCDILWSIFGVTVFLPLRGLSLTLTRSNVRFSQYSSIALRGGALLNRSRNAAITWHTVCPVCCVSRTHTHFATKRSFDRVTACVSRTENTTKFCGCGISRIHYLGHCRQTAVLHCTACCAVLCNLEFSLRCVLSGCTVTSRPPSTVA